MLDGRRVSAWTLLAINAEVATESVWRMRVNQRGAPGFDSVPSVIARVAEVDGQLRRRYSASILPVLFEHPLPLAATACGARFRPTTHRPPSDANQPSEPMALVALSATRFARGRDGRTGGAQRRSSEDQRQPTGRGDRFAASCRERSSSSSGAKAIAEIVAHTACTKGPRGPVLASRQHPRL
jgi:hypothetical protein